MLRLAITICAAALLLAAPGLAFATSFIPRKDAGVAAIDRQTGAVRWEAWREAEIPRDLSPEMRAAAREMLIEESRGDRDWGAGHVRFPLRHDGVTVNFVIRDTDPPTHRLMLRESDAAEDARPLVELIFEHRRRPGGFVLLGDLLIVRTHDNQVLAFSLKHREGEWTPLWRFDPVIAPADEAPLRANPRTQLQVVEEGVLVSTHERIALLDVQGKARFDHLVPGPAPNPIVLWEGFGHRVTLTEDRIFYRHAEGLVVLDRRTGGERWRHETHRSPYVPLMHLSDDLVLLQIGSDVPHTLLALIAPEPGPYQEVLREGLGGLTPARRIAALRLLRAYGEGYYLREVRRWIANVEENAEAPREERDSARVARALIEDWPAHRSHARLAAACLAALTAPRANEPAPLGGPAHDRILCWALLQELLLGTPHGLFAELQVNSFVSGSRVRPHSAAMDREGLRRLADESRRVIDEGPVQERRFAVTLLVLGEAAGAFLHQGELQRFAMSDDPVIWKWTVAAIARAGDRNALVELARRRPEDAGFMARALGAGLWNAEIGEAETRFWTSLAETEPALVATAFHSRALFVDRPVPAALHKPIRAYLEREAAAPEVDVAASQPRYDLFNALTVLNRFDDPQDVPLLERYLTDPVLGEPVKGMLHDRGVHVPPN